MAAPDARAGLVELLGRRSGRVEALRNRIVCMDALTFLRGLPAESVQLAVLDAPYYRVKDADWDNAWPSLAAFLEWCDGILAQVRRVLSANGSLYWFCATEYQARVELAVAKHFNVLNNIRWAKPPYATKAEMFRKEDLRAYFPASETIIFAEQYGAFTGDIYDPLKSWFRKQTKDCGISAREFNTTMGFAITGSGVAGSIFGDKTEFYMPGQLQYKRMQEVYPRVFNREYEDLRREYEDLRRPFSLSPNVPYVDTWTFNTVNVYPGKHPAEKPLAMIEHIIRASSRPGDLVLDCFSGSGTTADAARRNGRDFIACDFDQHWVDYGNYQASLPFAVELPLFKQDAA